MASKVLITNDQTSPHALIVHFSNDAATRLLKPGESVDAAIYQGMCINLIESEEDYSHGENAPDAPADVPTPADSPADIPLQFAPKEGE